MPAAGRILKDTRIIERGHGGIEIRIFDHATELGRSPSLGDGTAVFINISRAGRIPRHFKDRDAGIASIPRNLDDLEALEPNLLGLIRARPGCKAQLSGARRDELSAHGHALLVADGGAFGLAAEPLGQIESSEEANRNPRSRGA